MAFGLAEAPQLLLTCVLMFFGSFGAGLLPYLLRISEDSLCTVQSIGAGLLIGTALAVVIPEGFHSLPGHQEHDDHTGDHDHLLEDAAHSHHHEDGLAEWIPGAVLCAGFVAMFLLEHLQHSLGHKDGCGGHGTKHRTSRSPVRDRSLHTHPGTCSTASVSSSSDGDAALVGLVVHAAADGLAVGAASMSPSVRLAFLVGVAMVLHKAPVAFGLTVFLMGCKWQWAAISRGLLIFSLSSPFAAIITYTVLRLFPLLTSESSVALCVLFSGGTFLYAACMHILPHLLKDRTMSGTDMAAFCTSCFLPVLFSMGHHH